MAANDWSEGPVQDQGKIARELAKKHYQLEPDITRIFTIRDTSESRAGVGSAIRLLEVNAAAVPAGILPLHFSPAPASGIPYPSIIIEITPEEFERLKAHELELPNGWQIGEELPRSRSRGRRK
jgi:hypothetical protein